MGKLKNKHDHALTQWLKVIIFAILMLAPFFSVMSRCLYVTCNKNAKDSYSDNYVQDTTQITDTGQLVLGNYYVLNYNGKDNIIDYTGVIYYYSDINVDWYNYGAPTTYTYVGFRVEGYQTPSRIRLYYYDNDNNIQNVYIFKWGNGTGLLNSITFRLTRWTTGNQGVTTLVDNTRYWIFMYYFKTDTLDNAFEYSVNQLTQNQTFNWVTNTAIYQPVNAMTTGLGFDANNNIVALLLTYWTLLTAIYVIFDIILACFVKLTHLIQGND